MIRKSSTFGIEKTPSLDVIYENLTHVFDENIYSFFKFKKEYEKENKALLIRNEELKNEDDITNAFDSFLNFDIPKNENTFHFKFQYKTIESKFWKQDSLLGNYFMVLIILKVAKEDFLT